MKTRATSFALAALAVVSLVLPVLAADLDESPAETPEKIEEPEEIRDAILLDGEPAESVEYEIVDGVCYVTVSSFVSMMDAEAMVEEEDGVVSVNASTVVEVVALDSEDGESEAEGVEYAADVVTNDLDLTAAGASYLVTDDLNLTAAAGASYLVANGRYLYAQEGLIQLNGSVAAPVRLLARAYNLDVTYDAESNLVLLGRQEGAEPYLADASAVYDGDAIYWLSRIINAESGNQPLEGKIAVGNVVMNRVSDPRFPDSIYDVLFQKNQFTPAANGSIYRDPNQESLVAAMLVIDGAQVTPTALFFNGAKAKNSYAARTRTYVTTIGDHAFYR